MTFQRVLYGEERPEELALFDPYETLIFRVTTNAYELGNVSANVVHVNDQQLSIKLPWIYLVKLNI